MICHGFLTGGKIIPSWNGAERYPGSLEIVAVTPGVIVASEGASGSTRECYAPCPTVECGPCVRTCSVKSGQGRPGPTGQPSIIVMKLHIFPATLVSPIIKYGTILRIMEQILTRCNHVSKIYLQYLEKMWWNLAFLFIHDIKTCGPELGTGMVTGDFIIRRLCMTHPLIHHTRGSTCSNVVIFIFE